MKPRTQSRSVPASPTATRTMVLWCPDWPITAALREHGLSPEHAVALIEKGEVFACSPSAREQGVKRGLRLREAQARCTSLTVLPYDPALDARTFEPVIAAVEKIMPGVQLVRPGLCALHAQGPARYYGSEDRAATVLLKALATMGLTAARVGIADSPFAAEHAARSTEHLDDPATDAVWVVPPGESASFLGSFPLEVLEEPELAVILRRLGIRTLGDFAALASTDVRNRFGAEGALAHLKASGQDHRSVVERKPPAELDVVVHCEPPLVRIDELTFTLRLSAEKFVDRLRDTGLVCTVLVIRLQSESGEESERLWRHPRWFDADDVLDRVRWQLQGSGNVEHGLSSGISRVQLLPEIVEDLSDHADGLWGTGPDENIHHGLARVQSMLGHGAVLTAMVAGGRMLTDRRVFIPWGDPPSEAAAKSRELPWPGQVPGPVPATVFDEPLPVQVLDSAGNSVDVDNRGLLTSTPAVFAAMPGTASTRSTIASWAGPWPITERWWDSNGRTLNRFQVVDESGAAWLLLLENHRWWAEASYD
ncbi:DNA polymerase Y family protein [Arthrobacter sp. JZ12]|uniref:DNA polymerase Y family protein n=1 Tax=Arthrobacter sp. JZ12 TaxID=2654190 RepID=UPI002B461562|nr:DNA polymerase Y family protein [Arthrobacter sp. JZ12]WRH23687.1 DNA polymerase Y family protein [Arthrobacter sp. JZ12]